MALNINHPIIVHREENVIQEVDQYQGQDLVRDLIQSEVDQEVVPEEVQDREDREREQDPVQGQDQIVFHHQEVVDHIAVDSIN